MNSILNDVKKLLGITEEYDAFDVDIILNINSAFSVLNQLGVGPEDGFSISGVGDEWSAFNVSDTILPMVKQFIYLRTRRTFDPPTSSFVLNSLEEQINEYTFRLKIACEEEE